MNVRVTKSSELKFKALPGRVSADPLGPPDEDATVSLRVVKMSSDPLRTAHVHPYSAEAVYVVAGHGTLWVEGERTAISAGDTFLVPAGVKHATLPDLNSQMELICFFPHPDLSQNILELPGSVGKDVS